MATQYRGITGKRSKTPYAEMIRAEAAYSPQRKAAESSAEFAKKRIAMEQERMRQAEEAFLAQRAASAREYGLEVKARKTAEEQERLANIINAANILKEPEAWRLVKKGISFLTGGKLFG